MKLSIINDSVVVVLKMIFVLYNFEVFANFVIYNQKKDRVMTIEEKQLEFMIYCIESTAERLGRYGSDVYNKLKELKERSMAISALITIPCIRKSYIVDSIL